MSQAVKLLTAHRARLLRAALGFLSLAPSEPELQLLHRCFDNWRGIGDIVAGMARQEYDLDGAVHRLRPDEVSVTDTGVGIAQEDQRCSSNSGKSGPQTRR